VLAVTAVAGCRPARTTTTSTTRSADATSGALDAYDTGSPKMVYVLDIHKLVDPGRRRRGSITTIREVWNGGSQPECRRS